MLLDDKRQTSRVVGGVSIRRSGGEWIPRLLCPAGRSLLLQQLHAPGYSELRDMQKMRVYNVEAGAWGDRPDAGERSRSGLVMEEEMEIAIFGRDGGLAQRIIAPEERRQARMLWAFLISNLQTGFQVALEDGTGSITRDSGALVPVHLLERLMSGARLDELT